MGIRVSELKYIDVESVKRGEFTVSCKNKTRTVFIVKDLQRLLLKYIEDNGIEGTVFVTRSGRPIDRISIWRDMKKLCQKAEVNPSKVFPPQSPSPLCQNLLRYRKGYSQVSGYPGTFEY